MLEWFNAREATTVGSSLADAYLRDSTSASKTRAKAQASDRRSDVQRLLRRAVLNARPLKLNLFKRAKLLGSFKWRLIEQGIDRGSADELTQLLLLQLSGGPLAAPVPAATPPATAPRKRIDPLLSAADAAAAKGDYAETVVQLQDLLAIDPDHVIALSNLGDALCFLGRYPEAERAYRRSVQIDPRRADTHLKLGKLLQWRGDFLGSETTLRRATKLEPRSANALCSLGDTLSAIDRVDDAKACFEKALRLKPNSTGALCGLAWLLSAEGRFEQSDSLVRRALEVDPDCSEAQALLVMQRRMTLSDEAWLEGVQRMLARQMAPIEEAKLRFAMGKFFDDLGKYSQAFEEYHRGNELRRKVAAKYDRAERTAWVDDVIRLYSADHVAQRAEGANDSARPVFVVGMMRSGTSLMEQIIASHPEAVGAGELQFWGMEEHKHPEILRQRPAGPGAQCAAGRFVSEGAGAGIPRIRRESSISRRPTPITWGSFTGSSRRHASSTCGAIRWIPACPATSRISSTPPPLRWTCRTSRTTTGSTTGWSRTGGRCCRRKSFWKCPMPSSWPTRRAGAAESSSSSDCPGIPGCSSSTRPNARCSPRAVGRCARRCIRAQSGAAKNYQKFIGPLLKLRDLSP